MLNYPFAFLVMSLCLRKCARAHKADFFHVQIRGLLFKTFFLFPLKQTGDIHDKEITFG